VVACGLLAALLMGVPSTTRPETSTPLGERDEPRAPVLVAPKRVDDVRAYALAFEELTGLPRDVPPGTRIDLWVAWDPPVTKGPRLQRLLTNLTVEKMAPGVTPGTDSVILAVPEKRVARLLYGDRYGELSATMIP
jgi:hypothetical protein